MKTKKCDVIKAAVRLLAMCLLLLGIASCEKDDDVNDNVVGYTMGISSWQTSSSSDLTTVKAYLDSKGCVSGIKMYNGDNTKADAQAKAEFETLVSKLKHEEVAALGLKSSTKFTYSVSRLEDPTKFDSEIIIVASWSYPQ